jgi:hypothetical protein
MELARLNPSNATRNNFIGINLTHDSDSEKNGQNFVSVLVWPCGPAGEEPWRKEGTAPLRAASFRESVTQNPAMMCSAQLPGHKEIPENRPGDIV